MGEETLTLEQVKKVERFAWHDLGYVWIPGSVNSEDGSSLWLAYAEAELKPESDGLYALEWDLVGFIDIDSDESQWRDETGWHHLPGCDCEFCK